MHTSKKIGINKKWLQLVYKEQHKKKSYKLAERSVPFCFIVLNQNNQVLRINLRTFPQGNSYILTQLICNNIFRLQLKPSP